MYPGFSTSDMHNDFSALTLFPNRCEIDTQNLINAPRFFPENTMGLHMESSTAAPFKLAPLFTLIVPPECKAMNPRSAECFRHMQEKFFGKRFEDIAPQGETARRNG